MECHKSGLSPLDRFKLLLLDNEPFDPNDRRPLGKKIEERLNEYGLVGWLKLVCGSFVLAGFVLFFYALATR